MFELAYQLRMPVHRLCTELSYEEFYGWINYFSRRPPQWRDDHRAAIIAQSMAGKMNVGEIFPTLAIIANKRQEKGPMASLATSKFRELMENAIGGERIKWEI